MYIPKFKINSEKVPILKAKEIDAIAERFIAEYDPAMLNHATAINIESFIEFYLKLEMEYDDLSEDGNCLGMTVFNDTEHVPAFDRINRKERYISAKAGTVIIDNTLLEPGQEKRLRFTLGHEAGHWVFHKAFYGYDPGQMTLFDLDTAYVRCRSINSKYLYENTYNWDSEKWMEWQADRFAAGLLMPEVTVRKYASKFASAKNGFDVKTLVESVSAIYEVSKQASFYRLFDLGIITPKSENDANRQLSLFD